MGITPVIAGVGAAASAGSAINSIANGSGSGSTQAQANQQGQQAEADKQQALAYWQALQQPTFNSNPYQTESVVGTLNPQTYSPYIGNMTQIQDSPEQQAQQEQAIAQLEQFAKGGLTPTDLASLNQIATSQAGSNSSQDQALQAQMRAAGQGGAGSQYAMEAANNQGTANNANSLYASALQTALQRQLSSINGADTAANNLD